jgi:hypothetical protein
MFPESHYKTGWTMTEIDQFDVHFFDELMSTEIVEQEKEIYLSAIW